MGMVVEMLWYVIVFVTRWIRDVVFMNGGFH